MTAHSISGELGLIVDDANFPFRSAKLVETWISDGVGIEAVEPILRFMEDHPSLDYGAPGALAHFMERFLGQGYEEKVLESVERTPTSITVWLVNRLLNVAGGDEERSMLLRVLQGARTNARASPVAVELAQGFLRRAEEP